MATSAPAPDADANAQGAHLSALNSTALGTLMPTVTLPNGQKVQTGTIGALIVHIKEYDAIMARTPVDGARKRELEGAIAAALPVLKTAGMCWCELNSLLACLTYALRCMFTSLIMCILATRTVYVGQYS